MIKYAIVLNELTGLCDIATGTNEDFYKSIGMELLDVQQSDVDGLWYLIDKCPMKTDEQKAQKEAQRIAMLNLTGADVERAIYKAKGMDFDDIIAFLEAQPLAEDGTPQVDIKALKIELKANNFYRGSEWVATVGAMLGFTPKQLDLFFETNDYTKLITQTPSETPTEEPETQPTEETETQPTEEPETT